MKLKAFALLSMVFALTACSSKNANFKKHSFNHQQGANDYSDVFYYSDEVFDNPSTTYNNKLASLSICFAMASFASSKADYSTKYSNSLNFLEKCGFEEITVNAGYQNKPTTDSFGMIFGTKKLGDYTVIAIGTRGANYESEWASNVTIGNQADGYHLGFEEASNIYLNSLKAYIAAENITGNIKIWAAGYSRAGATTNIAIGKLDGAIRDNIKLLGENVNVSKENVYAYCFEPPMGVPNTKDESGRLKAKSETYNNIFNIVNFNDPVPYVAMQELGFTRFGIDCYLPDTLTTLHFDEHFKNFNIVYRNLQNYIILGDYQISSFEFKGLNGFKVGENTKMHSMTQGLFLKEFFELFATKGIIDDLTVEEAKAKYVEKVQTGLRTIFQILYTGNNFKGSLIDLGTAMIGNISTLDEVDYLLSDIQREPTQFVKDLKPIITRGLVKLNVEADAQTLSENIVGLLELLAKTLVSALETDKTHLLTSWFSKSNLKSLASGHYPEICESHVKALDDLYVSKPFEYSMDGRYHKLTVNDPNVAIHVYNGNDEIVRINDGDEIDNKISYFKKSTGAEIYLPYYEDYKVTFNGAIDFKLEYYDQYTQGYVLEEKSLDSINSFVIDNKK